MSSANEIHTRFGNVFALNLYAPLEPVHSDLVEAERYKGMLGNKIVYRYYKAPDSWGIKGKHRKPVHVDLNAGSFFAPHRDLFTNCNTRWVRLNCFANHSHPEECTYVIDGKIQYFKTGQWMCINPCMVHYSFCFKDNTVHYIIDIDVADQETYQWFLSNIEYCDRPAGEEGYK
jgi:hypothetical protein